MGARPARDIAVGVCRRDFTDLAEGARRHPARSAESVEGHSGQGRRGLLISTAYAHHTAWVCGRYAPDLLSRVAAGWRRIAEDERRGVASAAHIAADLAAASTRRPPSWPPRRASDSRRRGPSPGCVCLRPRRARAVGAPGTRRCAAPTCRGGWILRPPGHTAGRRERALARTLVADYALDKPMSAAAFEAAARALSRRAAAGLGLHGDPA